MSKPRIITLPWPPSTNTYYRRVGSKTLISREGRDFRERVQIGLYPPRPMAGSLMVVIEAHPPDRRRRDIDNLLKATLDSMQHAGVYRDDNQIADLRVIRCGVHPGGKLLVRITQIEEQPLALTEQPQPCPPSPPPQPPLPTSSAKPCGNITPTSSPQK